MTTEQLSLLQGDALSQHRFVLGSILEDALRVIRAGAVDGRPADRHEIDRALILVERIATELRSLGGEDPIPF